MTSIRLRSNWDRYWHALATARAEHLDPADVEEPAAALPAFIEDATNLERWTRISTVGIFVILLVAALKLSSSLSLPIVCGIVLGLCLGPLADRAAARGIPRGMAAIIFTLLPVMTLLLATSILAAPLSIWYEQIPAMIAALRDKLQGLLSFVERIQAMSAGPAATPPTQAVVVNEPSAPLIDFALSSTTVLAGVGVTFVTLYFYLATRRKLKARALKLCLGREMRETAGDFFERIERRVAHYLGMITVINLMLGVVTGLIVAAAGLPFAPAWAAFAALMNYVAVIGPLAVAVALLGAGFLTLENTLFAVVPAALYLLFHMLESQFITPVLIGRRLTISPALVFGSLIFWLWVWGPLGAVISAPLLIVFSAGRQTLTEMRGTAERQASSDTPGNL